MLRSAPARAAAAGTPVDRPFVTVDVAIFAIVDGRLQVLLVKRARGEHEPHPGRWALPGGFVDVERDASLDACARRKLREKTGVHEEHLEQLKTVGGPRRDPRGWSVTTVYFALIPRDRAVVAGGNASDAAWFPVEDEARPRPLAFDHDALLQAALERLRAKVEYTVLPAALLPESFTLPELQRTFETVLGRELDKSAFRTRMLSAGVIEETGEMRADTRRPAVLYRLSATPAQAMPGTFRKREG
ncbi:MAG: NUDIX domain-containing protein [Burkholderiales bacterium]|jgi:8-oxo-dGTP diphosphatase